MFRAHRDRPYDFTTPPSGRFVRSQRCEANVLTCLASPHPRARVPPDRRGIDKFARYLRRGFDNGMPSPVRRHTPTHADGRPVKDPPTVPKSLVLFLLRASSGCGMLEPEFIGAAHG